MFKPVQFGKYYLTERLAVGGMAEIFKAKMYGVSGFEKPMVVKQILPQYARNGEFIKMFIDEAKIAVSLTHGNIIPVYELGRCDGVYFIAMEYIHGKNLGEILEEATLLQTPMDPELALYVAIEICKGLDYAHRRLDPEGLPLGVVHRDVSPPNLMVSFTGEVKLADFGIAKAQHKLGSTDAGVVKGTYGYMAPEQLQGSSVDHRTDIFSCGILLHEMLTNQRLFSGGTDLEAIERVKVGDVTAPSAVASHVRPEVDPIVLKALARSPEERYQSASELQLELSRVLYAAGSGASASSLALYMRSLFPQSVLGEHQSAGGNGASETFAQNPSAQNPVARDLGAHSSGASPALKPAAKPDNSTRSYAVRDLLDDDGKASQRVAQPVHQVGAAPVGGETRAMPGLSEADLSSGGPRPEGLVPQEGLAPLDVPDLPGLSEIEDLEKTAVFRRKQEPAKPEVPELRFSARSGEDRHQPSLFGPPSREVTDDDVGAALDAIDGAAESGSAPPPADAKASKPAAAAASGAGGDSGLMALLGRPATDEQPAVGPAAAAAREAAALEAIEPTHAAERRAPPPTDGVPVVSRRRRPPSSALSSTMRLFIQGLDEEHSDEGTGAADDGAADAPRDPTFSGLTGVEDTVPRTIKPTVLGWALILLIVLGAAGFVVYKKTGIFGGGDDDIASTLGDDIKLTPPDSGPAKPEVVRADLVISTEPAGAYLFLHLGEAPTTTQPLDSASQHVLRVEREGYRTAHRLVKPEEFTDGKAKVQVTIAPAGAGTEDAPPAAEAGGPGKKGTIEITTDPPAASVWLLVGRDRATLPQVEAKRYYFKALLTGHEPAYLTVVADDFKDAGGNVERKITLDASSADGGAAATSAASDKPASDKPASDKPASDKPAVQPGAKPKASKPRATTRRPRSTSRRPRSTSRRPRRPKKAARKPKKASSPAKKKPAKKKGIAVPSWAR